MVSVVQREWAAKNPRATFMTPITVGALLNSRIILPVPLIAVLPGDRWRRRKHPKIAILAWYVVG